jgi:hypothetical protein
MYKGDSPATFLGCTEQVCLSLDLIIGTHLSCMIG